MLLVTFAITMSIDFETESKYQMNFVCLIVLITHILSFINDSQCFFKWTISNVSVYKDVHA